MAIHLEVRKALGLRLGFGLEIGYGRRAWKSARHGAWPCERGSAPGLATVVCCSSLVHSAACWGRVRGEGEG